MKFKHQFLDFYASMPGLSTNQRAKVIELCVKFDSILDQLEQKMATIANEPAPVEVKKVNIEIVEQIPKKNDVSDELPLSNKIHEEAAPLKKKKKFRLDN